MCTNELVMADALSVLIGALTGHKCSDYNYDCDYVSQEVAT